MKRQQAFTLAELTVALALALVLTSVVAQGLIAAGRSGERLALLLRERAFQRRTLALVREELAAAQIWHGATGTGAACGLSGRTPVLQMDVDGRRITYSLGTPPSPIWRGRVLMRCGPAYGLDGELSTGAPQNRVVLDALASGGLHVAEVVPGVLRLRLRQEFSLRSGAPLPLELEMDGVAPPR